MKRILVAVDDSPPALAAASAAIELATGLGARLHLVTVAEPDHDTTNALHHVTQLAVRAGLSPSSTSTSTDGGPPFEVLLRVAQQWDADLIVMGSSDTRRAGEPHVGSQTEHLLEFTQVPVLVVPHPPSI